jgi:hypothetical protein
VEDGLIHRESASLKEAIIAATGVSHGLAFHMPSTLLGGFGEFNLRRARGVEFVKDRVADNPETYVITGSTNGGNFTLWVDKKKLTIRQLQTPLVVEMYDELVLE